MRNAKEELGKAEAAAERYEYDFGQEDSVAIVALRKKLDDAEFSCAS